MKSAEEWANTVKTYGGKPNWLARQFRKAQREAAEDMREQCAVVVRIHRLKHHPLSQDHPEHFPDSLFSEGDILALPLPGDE